MAIKIPKLHLSSSTLEMDEISIGDAISISSIRLFETQTTEFLKAVIKSDHDPLLLTASERMYAVAHYMAARSAYLDGDADFQIGSARYSAYLDHSQEPCSVAPLDHEGDRWIIRPLIGAMLESIERVEGEMHTARAHWHLAVMAAQLSLDGDSDEPDPVHTAVQYDQWLLNKMNVLGALPENDFLILYMYFTQNRIRIEKYIKTKIVDDGMVAMPINNGGGGTMLPPARFPVAGAINDLSIFLSGKLESDGD